MSIEADLKHKVVWIANKGESALLPLGMWSIGVNESANTLDTVKAKLPGLSACTTLRLPMEEFTRSARIVTTPFDEEEEKREKAYGTATVDAVQDVFVTLRAPSLDLSWGPC